MNLCNLDASLYMEGLRNTPSHIFFFFCHFKAKLRNAQILEQGNPQAE